MIVCIILYECCCVYIKNEKKKKFTSNVTAAAAAFYSFILSFCVFICEFHLEIALFVSSYCKNKIYFYIETCFPYSMHKMRRQQITLEYIFLFCIQHTTHSIHNDDDSSNLLCMPFNTYDMFSVLSVHNVWYFLHTFIII